MGASSFCRTAVTRRPRAMRLGGLAQRESIGFASQGSRVQSPHPPLGISLAQAAVSKPPPPEQEHENRIVERSAKHKAAADVICTARRLLEGQ